MTWKVRALGAEVVRAARQFLAEGISDYSDDGQFTFDPSGQSASAVT